MSSSFALTPGVNVAPAVVHEGGANGSADTGRLRQIVETHFDFVWRSLRRLGVTEADADDGAQLVFLTVARRLADIQPDRTRGFLFAVARRTARDFRKRSARHAGVAIPLDELPDAALLPDDAEDRRRRLAWLDLVLDRLEEPLRVVFVLSEIDAVPMREIAEIVGIPQGTVASRLRRARVAFEAEARRLRAVLARRAQ